MAVAALVSWVLTAGGGLYMLATWIAKGGVRNRGASHFPPAVIFGHFALAAVGLLVWIGYLIFGGAGLAWTGFVLLLPVAALGFVMLARWVPTYRSRASVGSGARTGGGGDTAVPERHFPVVVVGAHGLLAVVTLVLVLLAALGT
jgi:hypothetical protein